MSIQSYNVRSRQKIIGTHLMRIEPPTPSSSTLSRSPALGVRNLARSSALRRLLFADDDVDDDDVKVEDEEDDAVVVVAQAG